jgi:hypothetical protein
MLNDFKHLNVSQRTQTRGSYIKRRTIFRVLSRSLVSSVYVMPKLDTNYVFRFDSFIRQQLLQKTGKYINENTTPSLSPADIDPGYEGNHGQPRSLRKKRE